MSEFDDYISEVRTYWEDVIDESGCDVQDDLDTYINDLETKYDDYISVHYKELFQDVLEAAYTYVTYRHVIELDSSAPTVEELVEEDDMRNIFYYTDIVYPDKEDLFTLEDCELSTTDSYTDIMDSIPTTEDADEEVSDLKSFKDNVPVAIKPVLLYKIYKKPSMTVKDIDIADYVLNDMYMDDVLDTFKIEIDGVNINK